MSLSKSLDRLVTPGAYPGSNKARLRWGQIIRSSATLAEQEAKLTAAGNLVSLDSLGKIRGGVVTRANAFFLVRELPFDQIPARLKVTRSDLKRVAVIVDGLDYVSKIERQFLKPVIKGPESLESAFAIKRSDLRLFDVEDDQKALEKHHANGALAYLRRGETVNYKTSDDDLKGGIPSQRSQVKNRKPFWYSLQGEQSAATRIIFPEHVDRRYVSTLVEKGDNSVVIDKLYLFEPKIEQDTPLIHAAMYSLLTWYQIELRGRSQLGQGVLELKIPDFAGLLLINPGKATARQRSDVLTAFAKLPSPGATPSLAELGTADRHAFDLIYLKACGFKDADTVLLSLERSLRALAGERSERRLSVADAKITRNKTTSVAASVDAYAARLAASLEPHPDPRSFMKENALTEPVQILSEVDGHLDIGVELFNQGEVFAGGKCIARAGTVLAAQFVRGVLLVQPDLSQVEVPTAASLTDTIAEWTRASRLWHKKFKEATEKAQVGIEDPRTRASIEQRALRLLHAV